MATSTLSTELEKPQIVIQTSDNETFSIDKEVIEDQSSTIKEMLDDTDDPLIPLPNITSKDLPKIIEYCNWRNQADKQNLSENARNDWINNFIDIDKEILYTLILGANYLGIQSLLDISCKAVANMIKGKTPDEIRETFNIVNDFTPEEEEEIRRENSWCEDI